MQTHYPYFVDGDERPVPGGELSPEFNRYLNALGQGDRALGRLLDWLDATGRADDTLVVVLGDHGQAFGQHNNYGHAGRIYEENLRIPLVLINRRLFSGQTYGTPCGVSDITPTVAEIMRLSPDPRWQGRSLFARERTGRVYFFAAWSDFLLGYRDGDMKVIFNATRDRTEVYDLAHDPFEHFNLADRESVRVAEAPQRIAAWVQFVERSYSRLLERTP